MALENYNLINDYNFPIDSDEWLPCPNCNLKPKVWIFDNGQSTGCGCGESRYDHFSIHAESIMSYAIRNAGSIDGRDRNELKNNWNHWVKTGEIIFQHAGKRSDGRW
jgi:hypothetical protein